MAELLAFLGRTFDPAALLLVFAGSLLVAFIQVGADNMRRLPGTLRPLLHAHPCADRDAARRAMLRVEHVTHLRGIGCADRVSTTAPFLKRAIDQLANAPDEAQFERWARDELAARSERHQGVIRAWSAIADAAPALGMAGTIIGLIRMFAAMDDPGAIGPAMALALLTTLYGLVLANMVAGPIAARLALLSEMEIGWQLEVLDRMLDLARAELVGPQPALRQADVARPRQNTVREAA